MPEREVRYCMTEDGVRIAYYVEGEGRPLVFVVPWPGSIELEPQLADACAFYEELVEGGRSIVRFDVRGTGASQRDVDDVSIAANVRDLAALVDRLDLGEFDLFAGPGGAVHMAVAYSVDHAERVGRIVLWEPQVRLAPDAGPVAAAQRLLIAENWRGATRVLADSLALSASPEVKRWIARSYRETLTPDVWFRYHDTVSDISAVLPHVRAPVLILHARADWQVSVELAREVAALLPDARLTLVDGDAAFYYLHHQQLTPLILKFLGPEVPAPGAAEQGPLRIVLFTDLVGHTEMMQRLGDEKGRALLREHERITREVLQRHGGVEVKTMGDGFMASFASVTKAVECAVALQRAVAAQNREPGSQNRERLQVRVGLNAGEPIAEEGDLFGSAVILASRVAAQAGPGEILIPEPVRHLLSGKEFLFADRGEVALKGFDDAVRLYEVRWREETAS